MNYCVYYQAHVKRSTAWLFVGILRSYEHLAFDRTLDKQESVFEFFVPEKLETYFLEIMEFCEKKGLIDSIKKLPNRCNPAITV